MSFSWADLIVKLILASHYTYMVKGQKHNQCNSHSFNLAAIPTLCLNENLAKLIKVAYLSYYAYIYVITNKISLGYQWDKFIIQYSGTDISQLFVKNQSKKTHESIINYPLTVYQTTHVLNNQSSSWPQFIDLKVIMYFQLEFY